MYIHIYIHLGGHSCDTSKQSLKHKSFSDSINEGFCLVEGQTYLP